MKLQHTITKWKAGEFYPNHKDLTPFPKGKTAEELGLKVGDLVVRTDGQCEFDGETIYDGTVCEISSINEKHKCFRLKNIGLWECYHFAPLPDTSKPVEEAEIMEIEYKVLSKKVFKKKPKLQKIQSAVWQYEDVRMEEGKLIFPKVGENGYFTPESLAEFLKKGRRVREQYKKIKF